MKLENIMLNKKKLVPKDHILQDSVYMKCPEQKNTQKQKVDQWLLSASDSEVGIAKGYRVSF